MEFLWHEAQKAEQLGEHFRNDAFAVISFRPQLLTKGLRIAKRDIYDMNIAWH